jgi:hypothetical protein
VTIFPFIITRSAGSGFLAQEKKRLIAVRNKMIPKNLKYVLLNMFDRLLKKGMSPHAITNNIK